MSQIKLDHVSGFAASETILCGPGLFHVQSVGNESFEEHLQRAQAPAEGSARSGPASPAPEPERQSAPDTPPEADDGPPDAQGPAEGGAEENTTDQVSAGDAAEDNPAEVNEAPADADDQEASEAAAADSETSEEPQTSGDDPKGDENKVVVDLVQLPGDLLVEVEDAAVEKGDAEEPAPKHALVKDEGESKRSLPRAAAKRTVERALPKEQTPGEKPATGQTPSGHPAAKENPAPRPHTEAAEELVQETTGDSEKHVKRTVGPIQAKQKVAAAASPDQAGPQEGGTDETDPRQPPGAQVSRAHALGQSQPRGTQQHTIPDRVAEETSEPVTHTSPSTDAATTTPIDARAVSEELADSAREQKVDAADDAAKPAEGSRRDTTPESQSTAPMRVSLGGEARAASPQPSLEATGPGQVDRVRFVQRVARAFEAMGNRHGSVRLRLSPPELGSLRLEISVRHGMMTARVEAETLTARNLLLDNLPALRDRLAQQNIKVEQFHVDLTGRSPGGLPDQTAHHTEDQHPGANSNPSQATTEAEAETGSGREPGAANRPGEGVQLNVIV